MRATLLLFMIIAQLVVWDLLDKVRILISWQWARRAIDREITGRALRLFAIARLLTGLKLEIEIDPQTLPSRLIVVSNHQSMIDIVAIMAAFRHHMVRFVAKRELERWFPAVSRVLRVQRHALISRHGDFNHAMRAISRLGTRTSDGEAAAIFPEGTRARDGELQEFHTGAVRRLHAAQPLPIAVVAIDGGWQVAHMEQLARIERGHRFRLAVLAVLPATHDKRTLVAQIATAHEMIAARIAEWRRAAC